MWKIVWYNKEAVIVGDKNTLTQSDIRRGVGATGKPPQSAYDLSKYRK